MAQPHQDKETDKYHGVRRIIKSLRGILRYSEEHETVMISTDHMASLNIAQADVRLMCDLLEQAVSPTTMTKESEINKIGIRWWGNPLDGGLGSTRVSNLDEQIKDAVSKHELDTGDNS